MKLRITHETHYRYDEPVSISPHLLYLRPREHAGQSVSTFTLKVEPEHRLTTGQDAHDNDFCSVMIPDHSDHLSFCTELEVENTNENPFAFVLDLNALHFPFNYTEATANSLAVYLVQPDAETTAAIKSWLTEHFSKPPEATVEWLTALNHLIFSQFTYTRREEAGIQSPVTTLQRGRGACRDFAVLFADICRLHGLAARFVSGYLYAPEGDNHRTRGAMHAWAEVFLPGAGWKALDPTHGIWCDDRFVTVAHAADAASVNPVQGRYYSSHPVASHLDVQVFVEQIGN